METIELTWDQFEEQYKPIQNHITKRDEFNGWLFETYGEDNVYINRFAKEHAENVWTILDIGYLVIGSGWHFVDRFGYIITEIPFESNQDITVFDQEDIDHEMEVELDLEESEDDEIVKRMEDFFRFGGFEFRITSSSGELIANKITGEVFQSEIYPRGDPSIKNIKTFDIEEYKRYYEVNEMPESVDILDLGYDYEIDGKLAYEEPAHHWRKETKKMRKGKDI